MEINKIYNCDCIEGLKQLDDNSVDLTVTSPPYDNLRSYGDTLEWGFEVFKPIAKELYRVTKPGGVVVWVVGDACIKGSETCSSFNQALYFVNECGFKLHDTMIYEKNGSSYPVKRTSKRYTQIFEYMFVFVKGEIRNDITLIADKKNKWAGWTSWGKNTKYDIQGNIVEDIPNKPIGEFSIRNNIWKYSVSFNDKTGHPAVFPEKLAEDHILSWTREGDLVLDPFMGSGTTAKMAMLNNRNYIGFEKNTEYYEKSLERIGKYAGKHNESLSGVTITDTDQQEMELQVDTKNDNEIEGKTKLWNQLIEELNTYFNEQTLGILKNLKLVFKSKSNDERVKKIHGIVDETNPETVKEEIERLQTIYNGLVQKPTKQPSAEIPYNVTDITMSDITAPNETTTEANNLTNNLTNSSVDFNYETIDNRILKIINDWYKNLNTEEFLFKFLEKYYQLKRLPDAVIEVNERAREEKKQQEEKRYPIQMVQLREQDFVEKPKRKRRTRAEMEEARRQEREKESQVVIESTKYNKETGVVEVSAKIPNTLEKVEVTFDSKDLVDTNPIDELPFELTDEERRNLGVELADTKGEPFYKDYDIKGEPFYKDYTESNINGKIYPKETLKESVDKFNNDLEEQQVEVKVKRPRGRPRKNPVVE